MALDPELLEILRCPETREKVSPADAALVERVNAAIEKGTARRRSGETETRPIQGGLLREDGKYLYPIRDEIPIMLIDEAIDMGSV